MVKCERVVTDCGLGVRQTILLGRDRELGAGRVRAYKYAKREERGAVVKGAINDRHMV